ncbi:hypothetical protein [Endozoicomonas sp. ALB115]|uniref:hypothetical protein n=1 Tax=Endozoicomonas sp. ALB115 TaxID=3403074 RepID=UPI003BB5BEB5
MFIAIFWIIFVIVAVILAGNLGRNRLVWGLVATIFSPLVAGILLLVLGKTDEKKFEELQRLEAMKSRL